MNQTALRESVATALGKLTEVQSGEWTVLNLWTDAMAPPCFALRWGPDPWRVPQTWCTDVAQLEVVCVAARLTPEANLATLEQMVDAANGALLDEKLRPTLVLAPAPLEVAAITYLAARVQLRRPVDAVYNPGGS